MNEHDEALRKQTAFLGQPKGVGTLSFWCATRQVDKLNNENFFFPGTVYVPGYLCNVF